MPSYPAPSSSAATSCVVGSLQYQHLAWTATALGASFQCYQIQRSDDAGSTWNTIKQILTESLVTYNDYEAPIGVTSQYRIRSVRTDLAVSAWSSLTASALAAVGCEWIFTTNDDPTLNLAFNVPPEIEYQFLSANEAVFLRIYGRDYQIVLSPTEQRGVAFTLPLIVYASETPPGTAVDGVAMFAALRAMSTADVPYICVRDYRGNRFFAHVAVPDGKNIEPFNRYTVNGLRVTEVTATPAIL